MRATPTPTFKDLWTGLLRQHEITERFDGDLSSRMRPFSFHHLIIGAHSPYYYAPEERDGEVAWNVQTGLYYADAQYYYGVRPGFRYYLEAELLGGCEPFDLYGAWTGTTDFCFESDDFSQPRILLTLSPGEDASHAIAEFTTTLGMVNVPAVEDCFSSAQEIDVSSTHFNFFPSVFCSGDSKTYDVDLNEGGFFGPVLKGAIAWEQELCNITMRPEGEEGFLDF
jgi:hypothetical protein